MVNVGNPGLYLLKTVIGRTQESPVVYCLQVHFLLISFTFKGSPESVLSQKSRDPAGTLPLPLDVSHELLPHLCLLIYKMGYQLIETSSGLKPMYLKSL